MKNENCDHKYTHNLVNIYGTPSCEKCGQLKPYDESFDE